MSPSIAAAEEVRTAVARVGARMRARVAIRASVHAAVALSIVALLLVVVARLGWLQRGSIMVLGAIGVVLAAIAILAAARPVSALVAAQRADETLGLHDRLTSALTFATHEQTDLERAAIEDAARVTPDVDPRRVVKLDVPRAIRTLPLVAIAIVAAIFVKLPARAAFVPPAPPKARLVVEPDALAAEREAVRKLAIESRGKDRVLEELAKQLDALLAEVDKGKVSRAEAFDRLAALEAKLPPRRAEKPSSALAPVAKALAETKETRALADALKKDDLDSAKKELEKLAAAAERKQEDRELQRALDKASHAMDEAQKKLDAERDRRMNELKDEERKLQREKKERPDDEDVERRLQKNKRELERLEREKEEQAEQRRQLQRLQKDLQDAAEQLRQKMSPEAMKKAAEELGKMEDEIKKLSSGQQGAQQIAQLKEMLRRASRVEVGEGKPGQQGKGKGGKGGERDQKLSEFDKRAGGDTLLLGGDPKDGNTMILPLPMGDRPGEGGDGPGEEKPGDGIGSEHDPNMMGDATHTKTEQKLIHATGKAGAGPTRAQTILGASEKGFSKREYQRVYTDYAQAIEEVMSQEGVPPGYRYYVKRYFQLIRPRE